MRTWARVVGGLLLVAATVTQVGVARTLVDILAEAPSGIAVSYRIGYVTFFVALTCAGLAAVFCLVGVRWLVVTLAAVALGSSLASAALFVSGDLEYVELSEALRFNVTGMAPDAFFPSAFLAAGPTWLLLFAGLIVALVGRERGRAAPGSVAAGTPIIEATASGIEDTASRPAADVAAGAGAPPGWYPVLGGGSRWWDGTRWWDPPAG